MTDSWTRLCERVDALLNQVAIQATLDTPEEALAGAKAALKDLVKLLKVQPWPDIDSFAKGVGKAGDELTSADGIADLLATIQNDWASYQRWLVGDPDPEEKTYVEKSKEAEALVKAAIIPQTDAAAPTPIEPPVIAAPPQPPPPAPAVRQPEPVALDESFDSDAADLEVLRSDPELASMFIAEALDHLSTIEATVLQLEEAPDDQKLLNDVFRPFHTVKGNAGALGVRSVQEFAHKVENLLDLARSGSIQMGAAAIEVTLKSVDVLTGMISDLNARLAGQPYRVRRAECHALMVEIEHLTSGAAGSDHAGAVHAGSSATPSASATPEPDLLARATLAMQQADEEERARGQEAAAGSAVFGRADTTPNRHTAEPASGTSMGNAGATPQRRADDNMGAASVKVDTRKLDSLVDMVGELVIVQSLIGQDPALAGADDRLSRNIAQLKRISSDLQRNAMAMRMVPVRQTFQKMARLVRDLSKSSGKRIELELKGEDTELDRKVVEDINDPLMHMVRNSVDHGIESNEDRVKLGKPAAGRMSLSAFHQGGNIIIAIQDDGRGLNADRILAKAIEKGLVAKNANLSLSDIHQLIFRPGFSTAEKITEISGRGVGMDVVRRNIEALRGRIEIQTEVGAGTTFSIKLPLTLAIVEGLLLRVGEQRFVMPTFSIRESLRPAPERVHSVQGVPRMIQVRDSLLPLISLAQVFGIRDAITNPCEATCVVIEDDGRYVALLVDQLIGKQEVVVKSLGPAFQDVRGIAGGAILGDGRIGLILDAGGVISLRDREPAQAA
jgi:two-component system, chemotaxis family, sensor kinase CheA